MLLANPIGVGEVDTDGGCGIGVTCEGCGGNHLGRHTLNLCLAESGVDGGIVLKPLRIVADDFGAEGCFVVFEVHDALPSTLAAEGVAIVLGETIYVVDVALGIFGPSDVELVEEAEVACLVVLNQREQGRLLGLLCHSGRLLQPIDDLLDGCGVHTTEFVGLFVNLATLLDEFAVQTIGDWARVVLLGHLGIEPLGLGLAHTLVVVHRGGLQNIHSVGLNEFRGVELGVKDGRNDDFHHCGLRLEALVGYRSGTLCN